ncbi:replication-relaxation family protein [Kribbella monticola]|uniref:replication-relaxation family protein n=1 Tax=Kribbella monticola TaxID=2185285 RepID=UPI0013002D50|nr:replication-relaxation family protein [Kribbella monticola]
MTEVPPDASPALSHRDRAVVDFVGTFKQVTTGQIRDLLYAGLASSTPLDRALKRLCDGKFLARLTSRPAGGAGGGSGQHVYQLGPSGWRLLGRPGKCRLHRAVSQHSLEIADLYVALRGCEATTGIELIRFDREQAAWRGGGSTHLTPDAYVEIGNRVTRTKRLYFIEVDRATEKANKITDKLVRYRRAYERLGMDVFPHVLFIVPDKHRLEQIESLFEEGGGNDSGMFIVKLNSEVGESLEKM